ncbi:hypothetical protein SDC9_86107 [bioreactor metagenome]|uniref:Uncharacterized protein n=1 Tax=bioreactor metagenome TaxID=1076179 RepID=A0A644ZP96_9ZZZZ
MVAEFGTKLIPSQGEGCNPHTCHLPQRQVFIFVLHQYHTIMGNLLYKGFVRLFVEIFVKVFQINLYSRFKKAQAGFEHKHFLCSDIQTVFRKLSIFHSPFHDIYGLYYIFGHQD